MINKIVNTFGFTNLDQKEMNQVFSKYLNLKKVVLFGSRSNQSFQPYSDVDLAIVCDKDAFNTVCSLKYKLEEETQLPYFFDVIDLNKISSPELKKHISIYGKVIYGK